jgi:hypothetical protein
VLIFYYMEINLTTPALLFPAISLLLLAYTNRFLAIASLIRGLHSKYKEKPDLLIVGQMKNLRRRIFLIRNMQALGILSLFCCVLCMLTLFGGYIFWWKIIFTLSLLLLMASLGLSVWEIQISIKALKIQISDMELFKEGK